MYAPNLYSAHFSSALFVLRSPSEAFTPFPLCQSLLLCLIKAELKYVTFTASPISRKGLTDIACVHKLFVFVGSRHWEGIIVPNLRLAFNFFINKPPPCRVLAVTCSSRIANFVKSALACIASRPSWIPKELVALLGVWLTDKRLRGERYAGICKVL